MTSTSQIVRRAQGSPSLAPWEAFEASVIGHDLLVDAFFRMSDQILSGPYEPEQRARLRRSGPGRSLRHPRGRGTDPRQSEGFFPGSGRGPGLVLLDAQGVVLARSGSSATLARMAGEGLVPGARVVPSALAAWPHRTVTVLSGPRGQGAPSGDGGEAAVLVLVTGEGGGNSPLTAALLSAAEALLAKEAQLLQQENERQEMAHSLRKLSAFREVALATETPSLSTAELVRGMLGVVRAMVDADRAMLALAPPGTVFAAAPGLSELPCDGHIAGLPALKRVFEERLPVLVSRDDVKPEARELLQRLGAQAALAVPVVFQDGTCVAAVLVSRDRAVPFGARDLELLSFVSLQMGLALENTALRDRLRRRLDDLTTELGLAQRVQRAILPGEPLVRPGVEMYGFSQPARHVGGDFFDYWEAEDGACVGVLGDIMGKGVAAALLMALLRAQVRACAGEQPFGLPVLQRLRSLTGDDFRRAGAMATLQLLRVEPASRRLTWVVAGHHPPLLRRDGRWGLMGGPRGIALGLGRDFPGERSVGQCTLQPGDLVLLWSDGLLEAACPGRKTVRIEAVLDVVADLEPGDAIEATRLLEQRLAATVPPGSSKDDVTVLALSVPGHPRKGVGA